MERLLPKDAEGNDVTEKTVTAADVLDGKADFSFGVIEYSLDMVKEEENRTKEFVYEVTEVEPGEGEAKIAGMTYDTHKAIMKITVSDDGEGHLRAVTTIENNTFTNVYQSKLDYNSIGGLQISKTLNGRDLQKDQFTFTVTPKETVGSTTAGRSGTETRTSHRWRECIYEWSSSVWRGGDHRCSGRQECCIYTGRRRQDVYL